MADAGGTSGSGSAGGDAGAEFGKYFVSLGIKLDKKSLDDIGKQLTPIQQMINNFSKTNAYKDSFFGKMPGISDLLKKITPGTLTFSKALLALGAASKAGADEGSEFYNSLGFIGKGLVSMAKGLMDTGNSATITGRMIQAAMSAATLGIAALIAIGIELFNLFKNILIAGVDYAERLNDFNKIMGGVTTDRLMAFNDQINVTTTNIAHLGAPLKSFFQGVEAYMTSGISRVTALNDKLMESTLMLEATTGEAASSLATFFSGLYRGSGLSVEALGDMGNAFQHMNKEIEKAGILGTVSWSAFKEGITSAGTAFLVASHKGSEASKRMMSDIMSLTSMTQALGLSIGEINSKFEESASLLGSSDSPFRALLAISGGASFGQMLNNSFDRTSAMLKMADTLRGLNAQFGGNLNMLGEVAQKSFGISKDAAIKLATLTQEQRKAIEQTQKDAKTMNSKSLEESYKSVTGTLGSTFDRFKNMVTTMFQKVVGNRELQTVLKNISDTIGGFITKIGDRNSGFSKLVDKIGEFVTWIFKEIGGFLKQLEPYMNKFVGGLDNIMKKFAKGDIWQAVKKMLITALEEGGKLLLKALEKGLDLLMKNLVPIMLKISWEMIKLPYTIGKGIAKWFLSFLPDSLLSPAAKEDSKNNSESDDAKILNANTMAKLAKLEQERTGNFEGKKLNGIEKAVSELANNSKQQSNTGNVLSGMITIKDALDNISKNMESNRKEQSKLEGMKDTDLVVGRNGEMTLAGLEQFALEKEANNLAEQQRAIEEDQLEATKRQTEVTDRNAKATEENTNTLTELSKAMLAMASGPAGGTAYAVSKIWNYAVKPNQPSPAAKTL